MMGNAHMVPYVQLHLNGAPECMKIFGFMHGVNNPELTKRLNERVPKTLEEMMITTTAFIRRETVVASKKKVHTPWKPTPKEIFAAESAKFKPPPPMVTPADKRSINKFYEFHNDKGHVRAGQMGNRHCGSFSGRTWEGQVLDSLHGLLYKMKRSKGRSNHQWWSSKEVCMGQYSVSLWASGRDSFGQQRERAAIREAKAKSKTTRYYNARVRSVTFKPGNYVYPSNEASHAMDG
ncbi:hypothetical protein Tco_1167435 [Tanacetum coccineum]